MFASSAINVNKPSLREIFSFLILKVHDASVLIEVE